ncbi:MAG: riboflavin synthase [Thermomicrobiaceae bacterium]
MFTGIVEEIGSVISLDPSGGDNALSIRCQTVIEDVRLGDSINVNGVCLTVTSFSHDSFSVNLQPVTIRLSNLGDLKRGDPVNLERALAAGQRMGGHYVQGHVDGAGRILEQRGEGKAVLIRISAPDEVLRYCVERGFISVDGASLTIMELHPGGFSVSLVYHTQQTITLPGKRGGERVNLEVDVMAKYAEKLLGQAGSPGVDMDLLRRSGFA